MITDEIVYTDIRFGNRIMLEVGLWGGAKGNSHIYKGHREASVYFGHISSCSLKQCYIYSLDVPLKGTSDEYSQHKFS